MKLVILESPFSGDVARNVTYARLCVKDSLSRREAPLVSHLLYTQPGILDDNNQRERAQGIAASHAWYHHAKLCAVYHDLGISRGMEEGITKAKYFNVAVEYRNIIQDIDHLQQGSPAGLPFPLY